MHRVVIFGGPGSGKSTLARELSRITGLPVIERDTLGKLGSSEYLTAVRRGIAAERWIFDGAPYYLDAEVYARVDTVVVLSFAKPLVIWRVVRRSLRLARGVADGGHQPAGVRTWLQPDHAVRVAWSMHARRRAEGVALGQRPELATASVVTFFRPSQVRSWLRGVGRA